MTNRVIYYSTLLLWLVSPSTVASEPKNSNQVQHKAYACDNCDFQAATKIATENAPDNDCKTDSKSPAESMCDPVSKTIFVPVHSNKKVFKFEVTTRIDAQNLPVVSVVPSRVLPDERVLIDKYFEFYADLEQAVNKVSAESAELAQSRVSEMPYGTASQNDTPHDSCASHPAYYFKNLGHEREIKHKLATRLRAEFKADSSVISQYAQHNLLALWGDSFDNRIAFNVNFANNPANTVHPLFNLTLHKAFTKIDGFQYGELFGGNATDLTDGGISSCLTELLREKSEPDTTTATEGGGHGSFNNPFVGTAIKTAPDSSFCQFTRNVTLCHTDSEGHRTCPATAVTWTDRCGLKPG
ncbi:hypothetical protein [Alteromonas gilva]|uniref:Uncharacterized protein n=1 Tax=Alteromonas gilva TaxID=2987522 RepID=A0ABT5L7Z6_9ALTE|nr:hypothetical protein [Alteromonas gilva]MDC8832569.1 hypothetical protein [Alteromonas gilva]